MLDFAQHIIIFSDSITNFGHCLILAHVPLLHKLSLGQGGGHVLTTSISALSFYYFHVE